MQLIVSLFAGVVVGIIGTVPLGPISIYAAQQTMKGDTVKSIQVCIGSVIVDIVYCLIITMGLISLVFPYMQNNWVQGGLSLFIIAYGIKMLAVDARKGPQKESDAFRKQRERFERGHYNVLLGATMALANPTLFISWTAVISFITTHGLLMDRSWDKVLFSFAIGLGSLLWFIGLVFFVRSRRHTLSPVFIQRAGAATGLVLIGFGVYFTCSIIQKISGLS